MTTSSDSPSGEPQNTPAQHGPLEREMRDLFDEVVATNDRTDDGDGVVRILIAQTQAIYRLAREIDDLKAE